MAVYLTPVVDYRICNYHITCFGLKKNGDRIQDFVRNTQVQYLLLILYGEQFVLSLRKSNTVKMVKLKTYVLKKKVSSCLLRSATVIVAFKR